MYIYLTIFTSTSVWHTVYVCMYVCMYIYVCMYVCMYIYIYIYIYICIYICITYTYIHTHIPYNPSVYQCLGTFELRLQRFHEARQLFETGVCEREGERERERERETRGNFGTSAFKRPTAF